MNKSTNRVATRYRRMGLGHISLPASPRLFSDARRQTPRIRLTQRWPSRRGAEMIAKFFRREGGHRHGAIFSRHHHLSIVQVFPTVQTGPAIRETLS
jgi:hypothetical protein